MSKPKGTKVLTSEVFVSFVDILFAVVLGQSFVLLNPIFLGLISGSFNPLVNAFQLVTIFLMYGLVTSSWYGYHHSVKRVEITTTWRWLVDVLLLFVYYGGFAAASQIVETRTGDGFVPVLAVFVVTFMLYTIWDAIRIAEYRSKPEFKEFKLVRRLGETTISMVALTVAAYFYLTQGQAIPGLEWAYLMGLVFLLVIYRLVKLYERPPK